MRTLDNDMLAIRAKNCAEAAKSDSREQRAWSSVAKALAATGTIESARTFLRGLSIPTLRADALRMLGEITENYK
jgi:hypothetical protein